MYCPYPGNGIIVHQWLFLDAHSRKIIPSTMQLKTNSESHWTRTHIRITGRLCHHFFQTDNVRQVSETKWKSTVFPALILVYTVIVTDQRKRNILPSQIVNLGFSWGVRREYLSDLWPNQEQCGGWERAALEALHRNCRDGQHTAGDTHSAILSNITAVIWYSI